MKLFLTLFVAITLVSCSHTYYVVRHAEKAAPGPNMSSDVPLSDEGQKRAQQISERLKNAKIDEIFSTNTIRTKTTAKPIADYFKKDIQVYGPVPDTSFIKMIKAKKKNILIVGHSNTVDDIANGLAGEKKVAGDLSDSEYNKLYIIRVKGKKVTFEEDRIFK
jgi:phosphohistidine phosphatase SixA